MLSNQQVNDLLFIVVLHVLLVKTVKSLQTVLHHPNEVSLACTNYAKSYNTYFVWVDPAPV